MQPTKRALYPLLLCCLWAAGCGASQMHSAETIAEFEDEGANPYNFNRAIAHTLLRTDQAMEASRVIQRLIKLRPEDPETHTMLGRAYLDMKQYELAERALKRALHFEQEHAPAHALLGVLLDTLARHGEAQHAHRRAVNLDPEKAAYHNNLGFSLYLSGQYRAAARTYQASLAVDVAQPRVHNNLGFAYAKLGQFAKAEQHFSLAGPPAQASNNLGYIYESRGELARAYEYYYLALRKDPRLVPARANLDRICARIGRTVPHVPIPEIHREALPPAEVEAALSQAAPPASTAPAQVEP